MVMKRHGCTLATLGVLLALACAVHAQEGAAAPSDRAVVDLMDGKSYGQAEAMCQRMLVDDPANKAATYNLACALARQARTEHALDALEMSQQLGFDEPGHAMQDEDLLSLRDDPRFKAIVARMETLESGKPRDFPALTWALRATYETKHYHLETNVPVETAIYIESLLEAMYAYYQQWFHGAPAERMRINIFAHYGEFAAESEASLHHRLRTGEMGFYVHEQHAIYLPWVPQPELTPTKCLIHEGFHEFYDFVLKTTGPLWFNEAMATCFENATFDGERIHDGGISPSKLQGMQTLLSAHSEEPLGTMMARPYPQFLVNQYCEAWSFLFWIMWGDPDQQKRAKMRRGLTAYIDILNKPENQTPEAFARCMGIDLAEATPAWKRFVMSLDAKNAYGGLAYMKPKLPPWAQP